MTTERKRPATGHSEELAELLKELEHLPLDASALSRLLRLAADPDTLMAQARRVVESSTGLIPDLSAMIVQYSTDKIGAIELLGSQEDRKALESQSASTLSVLKKAPIIRNLLGRTVRVFDMSGEPLPSEYNGSISCTVEIPVPSRADGHEFITARVNIDQDYDDRQYHYVFYGQITVKSPTGTYDVFTDPDEFRDIPCPHDLTVCPVILNALSRFYREAGWSSSVGGLELVTRILGLTSLESTRYGEMCFFDRDTTVLQQFRPDM